MSDPLFRPTDDLLREALQLVNACAESTGPAFDEARRKFEERAPKLVYPLALKLSAERERAQTARREALEKALGIVRHAFDNGWSYESAREHAEGRLSALIEETPAT